MAENLYIEKEDSMGEIIKVLPVGTKIRHKKHPELIGMIYGHEYHKCGKISPMPYCVHWDDNSKASDILGWFFVYPEPTEIEPIREVSNG